MDEWSDKFVREDKSYMDKHRDFSDILCFMVLKNGMLYVLLCSYICFINPACAIFLLIIIYYREEFLFTFTYIGIY